MKHPFISVIVPYYNTGKYLEKCVDSIISQSFKDFEIILVDDGSNDGSHIYARRYAEKYDNIISVRKENGGCNSARREGVSYASGDWITFVDSDDIIPSDAFMNLAAAVSEDSDIIVGFSFLGERPTYHVHIDEWRKALVKSNILLCTPWGKLFRHSIVSEECFSLVTNDKVPTSTDMLMNIKIAYRTEKDVTIIQPRVYCYNEREGNLSSSAKWTIDRIAQLYDEVVFSVPSGQRESIKPELIENRLTSLKGKFLRTTFWNRERISESQFVEALQSDIQDLKYNLSFLQRMAVFHSDSILTLLLYKLDYKRVVLIQYLKRHLSR